MSFLILKLIHILSAIILFGVGLGTVFYKIMADHSSNHAAIAVTSRHVVQADWWFTTPTVVIQPLTGILMARQLAMPLSEGWLLLTAILYVLTGLCWLPVVYLQIRMRDIANAALAKNQPLPPRYRYYSLIWMWLGVPAFFAMVGITTLMVFHGSLWS
ncbi:DUF2269 family protein [Methylobacter marinus]|uniref:DUF2269 family protein n=1 Tax=Methylobacter marinus TaxID=34058 RepID=UPI00036F5B6F|nr:DUF2269 domain-containing protein [Methylobacter marinus]